MNILHRAAHEAPADGGRVVLDAIDWASYEKFLAAVGDRPIRLTYDRGRLEIMAPFWDHEWWAHRFDRLILVLAEESGVELVTGGSTTFRRKDRQKGLEPDECYYVKNAAAVAGRREVDLARDPPPDLALEVEATRSMLDRMGIYASLGVPELWRFDGSELIVYHLGEGGYHQAEVSLAFPRLPLEAAVDFLTETQGLGDIALMQACRVWARKHAVPRKGRGRRKRGGGT